METVLPSGQKLTLSLLATINFDVVPFRVHVLFPALLTIFKSIMEDVFCDSVQHRLRFCLDHNTCVKTVAFQFILNWGNREKYAGWGMTVMLHLVKNSLVKKEVRDGALL
jgi:hypothetical protein